MSNFICENLFDIRLGIRLNDDAICVIVYFGDAAGKCARLVKLSGPNINIAYKPDGEHIAVVNTVCLVV